MSSPRGEKEKNFIERETRNYLSLKNLRTNLIYAIEFNPRRNEFNTEKSCSFVPIDGSCKFSEEEFKKEEEEEIYLYAR